jgi:ligand-binding sensor protein
MKLTDLLTVEEWHELEQDIHERFGMDTNVFNTDGVRITTFKSWVNRLCPEIKSTDKGQSFICAVAHMNLAAMGQHTKKAVIEECDAGLVKIVVPIFVDGGFLGAFGACGFLLDDGEVDSFLVNKITDIPDDTVEELAQGIPTISTSQAEALVKYIENRIKNIVAAYHLN